MMSAFTYTYRIPNIYKTDAQTVGEIMEELNESPDGLTPESLLNTARDEQNVLHKEFEWRDDVAGEKYRLIQASTMIRSVRVVTTTKDSEPVKVRAFIRIGGDDEPKHGYRPLEMVVRSPNWHQQMLTRAKNELRAFTKKYKDLEEISAVVDAIENFFSSEV